MKRIERESNRGVSAEQVRGRGAMDGAGSERRRGGSCEQEVSSWNPSTPVGAKKNSLRKLGEFFYLTAK